MGLYLCLYSQDWMGTPENAAQFVQRFLKRFRADQCWGLTFARACSKPRVGAFGGGAVFVTADEIKWKDTYDFIEEERKLFGSQHGTA